MWNNNINHLGSSPNGTSDAPFSHTWDYIDISLSCLYFLIGLPGNLLILRVQLAKAVKTTTDIFIIALAVTDLASCLMRLEDAVSILLEIYLHTDEGSIVGFFCSKTILFTTACLTAAIAVDRYDAICRHRHRLLTQRRAIIMSFSCLILSLLMMVPDIVYYIVDVKSRIRAIFVFIPVSLYIVCKCIVITRYFQIYKFLRAQARKIAVLPVQASPNRQISLPLVGTSSDLPSTSARLQQTPDTSDTFKAPSSLVTTDKKAELELILPSTEGAKPATEGKMKLTAKSSVGDTGHLIPTPMMSNVASTDRSITLQQVNPNLSSISKRKTPKSLVAQDKQKGQPSSTTSSRDQTQANTSNPHVDQVTPLKQAEAEQLHHATGTSKPQSNSPSPGRSRGDLHASTASKSKTASNQAQGFRQQKVTRMLLLATVVFFTLWAPYLAYETYSLLHTILKGESTTWHVHDGVFVVLSKVVYVNSIINPFIYSFANKRFKKECQAYLRSARPRCCKPSS